MHTWIGKTLVLGMALLALPAFGEDNQAENSVKYRQVTMQAMGKHMKLTSMLVKGEVDRTKDAVHHAEALHKSSQILLALFPEGTDPGSTKTKAKAEVWTDRDGFKAAVQAYSDATKTFVDAAASGDADRIKADFGKVGKSCGGCHDSFEQDD